MYSLSPKIVPNVLPLFPVKILMVAVAVQLEHGYRIVKQVR